MRRLLLSGPVLGALLGLLVATLYNQNCDSFTEILSGRHRMKVGVTTLYGGILGAILDGAVYVGRRSLTGSSRFARIWRAERARERHRLEREARRRRSPERPS